MRPAKLRSAARVAHGPHRCGPQFRTKGKKGVLPPTETERSRGCDAGCGPPGFLGAKKWPAAKSLDTTGAHPLYRSEPARHDECQSTGNWTRVSQRLVSYLPHTQGLLLIHNPSAECTEATAHEWLAQDHDANCHSWKSNPGLSSESPTLNRLRYQSYLRCLGFSRRKHSNEGLQPSTKAIHALAHNIQRR